MFMELLTKFQKKKGIIQIINYLLDYKLTFFKLLTYVITYKIYSKTLNLWNIQFSVNCKL